MAATKAYAALLATVGLLAINTTQAAEPEHQADLKSMQVDAVVTYAIDAAASELHLLVRRAGALSRLGHNHIISAEHMQGTVSLYPEKSESVIELTLPVADFVIDEPSLRKAEGEGFTSIPSQKDVDGTRRNMLGAKLLDVANFPVIRVTGSGLLIHESELPTLEITIQVKNTSAIRQVPLDLTISRNEISAAGEIELTHKELGLKPFRVMLGALQVANEITARFLITARRAD